VKNPPLPDWFHGTSAQHTIRRSLDSSFYGKVIINQHQRFFEPSWTRTHQHVFQRALPKGWFVNVLPTSTRNPFVAQYLLQNKHLVDGNNRVGRIPPG